MFAAETTTLNELKAKLEALKETRKTVEIELASVVGRRERLEAMEQDRDLILESYATLAPEALVALSPKERCKVYVILNLTVEAFAGGSLRISGAFGEETLVWEDGKMSRRSDTQANLSQLRFTLLSTDGRLEAAFELGHNARGNFPR